MTLVRAADGTEVDVLCETDLKEAVDAYSSKLLGRLALWFLCGGGALLVSGALAWSSWTRDVVDLQRDVVRLDTEGGREYQRWRTTQDTTLLQVRFELRRLNDRLDDVNANLINANLGAGRDEVPPVVVPSHRSRPPR